MSPAGAWAWLIWLGLLIGGVSLIVSSSPPGEAFGRKVLLWGSTLIVLAAALAAVAVLLPRIGADPQSAPSSPPEPDRPARLEWCIAEHTRLTAFYEQLEDCTAWELAQSRARLRDQETPRIRPDDDISEEDFWAIVCGAIRYQRAHENYRDTCLTD